MTDLETHYEAAVERRGYDPVDGPIGDLSASTCRHRFAFVGDADALAAATPAETLVSVGISPTGAPHVGTLGQVRSAVDLQRAGFDVRLTVADQVVYNAGGGDAATLRERAERYRAFALERGFDPERGRVVVQSEAADALRAATRLARRYDPDAGGDRWDERTAFEADLAAAYEAVESGGGDATAFSESLCGLLMAADNVAPLTDEFRAGYDRVLLSLGADNVGMARRFDDLRAAAGVDGRVVGLFSRLVPGVDGTPKMSKSIPGSGIRLDAPPERVRDRVTDPALDDGDAAESVVFGMVRLASPYDGDELDELRDARAAGDDRWRDAVREYADHLANAAEAWRCTGRA
ncbi:nucleotidyl transferase family protein [Halostella litorea]|uniref:hypothetical protein n=1 Tax=Halostella litorea TaxID=2528831 RepID=UPI001386F514|nr:hypothetical protein [Halostella litorea]